MILFCLTAYSFSHKHVVKVYFCLRIQRKYLYFLKRIYVFVLLEIALVSYMMIVVYRLN